MAMPWWLIQTCVWLVLSCGILALTLLLLRLAFRLSQDLMIALIGVKHYRGYLNYVYQKEKGRIKEIASPGDHKP